MSRLKPVKVPARIIYQLTLQVKKQEERVAKATHMLDQLKEALHRLEAIKYHHGGEDE